MSVHYRFKSALEYDTITFDGLHISVKDLKNSIIQQKRIGRSTDFDLRITNAQTQEVYEDENTLIPKNTSLLIARIPVSVPKQKQWEGYGGNDTPPAKVDEVGPIGKAMDLASLDAPEDDKIKAMMSQSTQDYDPSNYVKIRGANQVGPVPPSYRCYKCHQNGHWIKECPLGQGVEPLEIKKSTGIPQSFMIPVEGPQVPGAMMMSNGQYAVPALDMQAYNHKSSGPAPVQEPKPEIPEDLLCSICSDLLTDAVMIPCCGNSFCDECIRTVLLESEDHECPDCHEKDISPATLIPNRFLRKSVANFKNTTGYEKKVIARPKPETYIDDVPKKDHNLSPIVDSTEKESVKEEEKTVITEADSTEHAKSDNEFSKDTEHIPNKNDDPEGPPGVSPKHSPVHRITSKISGERAERERNNRPRKPEKRYRSVSPRKHRSRRSPSYDSRRSEERQGTPTRDEPPGLGDSYPSTSTDAYRGPPPPGGVVTDSILPPGASIQGPPPGNGPPGTFPPGIQPSVSGFPPQGPPPNFRMPPPGSQPPPFMAPGTYPLPPRPVFDPSRPPIGGPPGNFGANYGGNRGRDYGGRRGGRERTPPGVIDDPLAAFNRILREKDEKRARQQRMARRSWSRSRSRSRSYSRSPPPLRRRSRSPRRRMSRSRSRSFSLSRSRSRSYSKSPRGSPLPSRRSPPPLQARRGPPRFRSPLRSPPLRRRNDRDRNDFDRDYDRGNFRDKPRARRADSRDRFFDDRDRDFDRGQRNRGPPPPSQQQWGGDRDGYYPPSQDQPHGYQNRYPAPQMQNLPPPQRKYDDIGPPGVAQPPVPGLETELPPVAEYDRNRDNKDNGFERNKRSPENPRKDKEKDKYYSPKPDDRDRKERPKRREEKRSRTRSKSRSPEKWRNPSPKSREGTPDRPRKRRISTDSKDDKKREKDKHRDHSEDEKKRSKDKKKHKEKKEDKKKKKDKKDKHHKSKDKKDKKEEFKQVIPKTAGESDEDSNKVRKKIEERKKIREMEVSRKHEEDKERKKREDEEEKEREFKRLADERKKEERRLRFLEDEKKKREDLARKEEAKRKAIEEARRLLEEEEERLRLEKGGQLKQNDLYDQVIPQKDAETEIREDFKNVELEYEEKHDSTMSNTPKRLEEKEIEEGEVTDELENAAVQKEVEEEDSGILELHSDMDIKLDESDILAPVPEKSKWEFDEDGQLQSSPKDSKELNDSKTKVSSEVLKRAENVIFARAINSIRPIEIKKISGERAKLYADEKKEAEEQKKVDLTVEKPRLSVKERLGKKVDEPDPRVIVIDNRGSKSLSPFSRRERRIEVEGHRRQDRRRSRSRRRDTNIRDIDRRRARTDRNIDKNRRNKKEDKHEERKEKRKRSKSRSESEERKKKKAKDKKVKKEKDRVKKHEEESKKEETEEQKPKSATEKRKATLDEASFEPDYDLDVHDDEAESDNEAKRDRNAKKDEESDEESSSSDSSSSSSEEERRKKKRKKQKKKKKKESSSSESDSSSESSDSEKERKRKKHRKNKKKKKKSKHK